MYYYQNNEDQDGYYNSTAHEITRAINQGGVKGSDGGQVECEYVYEENKKNHSPQSKPYTTDGEYVLSPQDRDTEQIRRPRNERKPTVSDIYDEDHYTLARNSGFDFRSKETSKDVRENTQKKKGFFTSKNLMIISLIFGILGIGGICAVIVIRRQALDMTLTTKVTPPTTASTPLTTIINEKGSYGTACVLKGASIYKSFDVAQKACSSDPLCEGFHDNCGLRRRFATCSTPIETVDPGKDCNTVLYRKECKESIDTKDKIQIINGATWELTENWDCFGEEIDYVRNLTAWPNSGAVDGRLSCARECMTWPNCVAFNYPKMIFPKHPNFCVLKHTLRKSTENGWECGRNVTAFDYYTLLNKTALC